MKKLCTASIAALLSIGGGYALAQQAPGAGVKLTTAQCQSIWGKADAAGSGSISSTQAQPFVTNFKSADANADGKLSSAEFQAACQKGLVNDSASTGAGSGASGSGSSGAMPPEKQY